MAETNSKSIGMLRKETNIFSLPCFSLGYLDEMNSSTI